MIAIVVAVGVVYTVLPLDNLRGLLGMEKEAETVHSGRILGKSVGIPERNCWRRLKVSGTD